MIVELLLLPIGDPGAIIELLLLYGGDADLGAPITDLIIEFLLLCGGDPGVGIEPLGELLLLRPLCVMIEFLQLEPVEPGAPDKMEALGLPGPSEPGEIFESLFVVGPHFLGELGGIL